MRRVTKTLYPPAAAPTPSFALYSPPWPVEMSAHPGWQYWHYWGRPVGFFFYIYILFILPNWTQMTPLSWNFHIKKICRVNLLVVLFFWCVASTVIHFPPVGLTPHPDPGLARTRPPLKIRCDSNPTTVARGSREGPRATAVNRTRVTGSTAHAALMTQQTLWRRIRPAYTGPSIHLHFTLSHPPLIIWAFCLCSGRGWQEGERERQNGGGLVYVLFQ